MLHCVWVILLFALVVLLFKMLSSICVMITIDISILHQKLQGKVSNWMLVIVNHVFNHVFYHIIAM